MVVLFELDFKLQWKKQPIISKNTTRVIKNHPETAWSSEVEVYNLNCHLLVHNSAWEKCQSIFSFCSMTFLLHSALEKHAWFVPERKLVSKLISHREKWVCTLSPKHFDSRYLTVDLWVPRQLRSAVLSESSFDMTTAAYVCYSVFAPTLRAVPHEALAEC